MDVKQGKGLISIHDTIQLNSGVQIPCVGFGTYKAAQGNTSEVIRMAIEAGYRYFDTASFYKTETYLGEALAASGIDRREFFLASKLWKEEMGYEQTKEAFEKTLEKLETDYLDLYLIHWPRPDVTCANWKDLVLGSWKAMEELVWDKRIRAIGVSNFLPQHLLPLLSACRIRPCVDQLEFHPGYSQEAAVAFCEEQEIQVQAWSPLGRNRLAGEPLLTEMSGKYGVSQAQICLRYALQRGVIPIPKSSSMARMIQNQDLFSFEISEEDMYQLMCMPQTGWSGEHPDRERVPV